jgi:hypothetical protein
MSKRPSPSESATLFSIGTLKIGNDGNLWGVKKVGKSQRWTKVFTISKTIRKSSPKKTTRKSPPKKIINKSPKLKFR